MPQLGMLPLDDCELTLCLLNICVLCLVKESLMPGFIKQAAEKLKQVDKFLGTGQWFAGDRVRSFQTCCSVISVNWIDTVSQKCHYFVSL